MPCRRRAQRGHPWLFMLTVGTAAAALHDGAPALWVLLVLIAVWLVVR